MERRIPIPVAAAMEAVMQHAAPSGSELIALEDSPGRILAEDILCGEDMPPFTRSAYDGYALRAGDTAGAGPDSPILLSVVEEIPAGAVGSRLIGPMEAVRIMTGAMLPEGCDAVIMQELTRDAAQDGERLIEIRRACRSGDNLSLQGEDARSGETLLPRGELIRPGTVALLASLGYSRLKAARRPVVGVMASGSELLEVSEPLQRGKIRNSNAPMVCAQIAGAGAVSRYYGKEADDLQACLRTCRAMLEESDLVITTGGVSVGDYDFMPAIYKELGARVLFDKVAMRPGSVTTAAVLDGKLLLGLSGNPSACFIGFELFVRPVLRGMMQASQVYPLKAQAILGCDFPKANPFTRFSRAYTRLRDGRLYTDQVGLDKSSSILSLARANSLIVFPGGTRGYTAGDEVEVLLLEDREGGPWPWADALPAAGAGQTLAEGDGR